MINPYLWIVVVGGFVCFLVACGNGANDLANAFGTSYGSKVLTMLQIVIIATCCEFAGAVGLGSNVATTMSSGIASTAIFVDDPYVLMYGFLCALGASFIWLLLATWKDLPVSSHHAIAGGIIGFALVFGGGDAVNWSGHKDTFPFVSGVVPIVISWFISPLLSGIVAVIFYVAIRFLILQRKNAVIIAPYSLPIVVTVTFFLEFLFIFMIAASSKLSWTVGHSAWMAAVVGAGAGVLSIACIPLLKRRIRQMQQQAQLRAEETGMSVQEAMRQILAGGRAESHEDKHHGSSDSSSSSSSDDDEESFVKDAKQRRHHQPSSHKKAAPEDIEAARGSETLRLKHDVSSVSAAAAAEGGNTAESSAVVLLPASPVAGGEANASAFTQHKLLEEKEADGAVVRDDDDYDDELSSDGMSPHAHHHHHHHHHNHHNHRPSDAAQTTGESSGSSSSDNNNHGNRNHSRKEDDVYKEETIEHRVAEAKAEKKAEKKNNSKKGKKAKKVLCDKDGNPYTYVDGLRLASNGGYYDEQDVRIFDPRAEYMFRYLQVFTAACTSLAHGSNDVSNAIGPFSAIYDIYYYKTVRATADVPTWVLALGGAGIVVGLATYGLNIMRLLGEKIALITPFRGFSAELATALVVAFATTYGIPISSTHCITGAVVAISMLDNGIKNVKWMMVLKMYAGWIFTLVITAILSACFFSQGINSPIPTSK